MQRRLRRPRADVVARSRERARRRPSTRPSSATPNQTVPTGFAALPPPGPAMPVTETASVDARAARAAPSAMARATGSLTAPCSAISAGIDAQQLRS